MAPKISIITPAYNCAHYIEQTILSVRNQTYSPIEHIVFDGGSTDRTVEILKQYTDTYDLTWHSERDRGQSHAYNKGILASTGEWLYFLNSDDVLLDEESIKRVVAWIRDHPGYMIYMGKTREIDINGNVSSRPSISFQYAIYTQNILLNKQATVIHQGTFYNRTVFERAGLYSEDFHTHMDYEFHLRVSRYFDIATMDINVAYFRNHPGAKSQQNNSERFAELYRARRANGGKLWHRHNLYFLKRYLETNHRTRSVYQFFLRIKMVRYISKVLGWKGLGF